MKCQIKNIKNWFCYKRKKERKNGLILKEEKDNDKTFNFQKQTNENPNMFSSFNNFSPLCLNHQINSLMIKPQNIIYIPVRIINVPINCAIAPGSMIWNYNQI